MAGNSDGSVVFRVKCVSLTFFFAHWCDFFFFFPHGSSILAPQGNGTVNIARTGALFASYTLNTLTPFGTFLLVQRLLSELSLPKHRTSVPSRSRSAPSAWRGIFDGEVPSAKCSVKKRGANRMAIIAYRKTPQRVRLCLECSFTFISSRHEVHSSVWKVWPACPCFLPCFFFALRWRNCFCFSPHFNHLCLRGIRILDLA